MQKICTFIRYGSSLLYKNNFPVGTRIIMDMPLSRCDKFALLFSNCYCKIFQSQKLLFILKFDVLLIRIRYIVFRSAIAMTSYRG